MQGGTARCGKGGKHVFPIQVIQVPGTLPWDSVNLKEGSMLFHCVAISFVPKTGCGPR